MAGGPIKTNWSERIAGLKDLAPPLLIFVTVIGSIYAGLATPTESASLGTIAAILLVALHGRLRLSALLAAFEGTIKSSAMILVIIMAAKFLNFILTAIGFISAFEHLIAELGFGPVGTLLIVIGFYVVLGMFMETLSMMVITVPIVVPVLVALGYDPIWLGVLIILLIETALITPPVGVNLFVVQGVRGRGSVNDLMIGALPFVGALLVVIGVISVFPDIVLWLPKVLS